MTNRIVDKLSGADRSPNRKAGVEAKVTQVADAALSYWETARRSAEQCVAANPAICLCAALAVGIAVGWWVKRK